METQIGGKYILKKKIGSGSFGDIYLGTHIRSNIDVAIKLEKRKTRHPQLLYEAKLYRYLKGGEGIPSIYWVGIEGEYNVMIIELLGGSLEDMIQQQSQKRLSEKTVLMIADQMVTRMEYFHKMHILHRDVKPDNFLMGRARNQQLVHVIDYGLSKKFRDSKTLAHIAYRDGKNLTGTARYASINTHVGIEQSRRDDLESVAHVLFYLLNGTLPWQGLRAANNKEKYAKIRQVKQDTPVAKLCEGSPQEFGTYLNYCRSIEFEAEPDYSYCRQLFRDALHRLNYQYDFAYDWKLSQDSRIQISEEKKGN